MHNGANKRDDSSRANWQWEERKMFARKFIAFINALPTLAYCMTNCFRKPSTKVIPSLSIPRIFFCFFSDIELKQFRQFVLARVACRWCTIRSYFEFIWQSLWTRMSRGLRCTIAFVCKQIMILRNAWKQQRKWWFLLMGKNYEVFNLVVCAMELSSGVG